MSAYRLIYSTWPDRESAEEAARAAIGAGRAACANILPGAVSIFAWEGKMERSEETIMLLKTTADAAPGLIAALAAAHPYDTPALVALEIDAAASAAPFLDWIGESCAPGLSS